MANPSLELLGLGVKNCFDRSFALRKHFAFLGGARKPVSWPTPKVLIAHYILRSVFGERVSESFIRPLYR